jgi:isoaspartyl peptidase/L-asparaginase-like protein (Ntn-hydrolase superfamily)
MRIRHRIPNRIPHQTSAAIVMIVVAVTAAGCGEQIDEHQPAETQRADAGPSDLHQSGRQPTDVHGTDLPTLAGARRQTGAVLVTHGGVGSPPDWSPLCEDAARVGSEQAEPNGAALAMTIAAVVALENQPLLNAGTGANIRLDGVTIQMDAAVMRSDGEFAAVAAIERVGNPILVAAAVLETPHRLLVGDGATRFAHRLGFTDVVPTCDEAEAKYRRRIARLLAGEAGGGYDDFNWRRAWNYPTPPPESPPDSNLDPSRSGAVIGGETGDTVGAVARDAAGNFAAALSTGGTSITLDGRVGDVPIFGCGCYAGPAGAVACTGFGEEIIRQAMARAVYDLLADGLTARAAVAAACTRFPREYSLGLIAVGRDGWGVAANREMAWGQE